VGLLPGILVAPLGLPEDVLELSWSPKRVRIAILLVTLGLCAFFLAKGLGNLAALRWLPRGAGDASAAGDKNATFGMPELKGERPPDAHAILARNIFDPLTGPLWPPKEDDEPETATMTPADEAAAQALRDGQMPPPCDGTVRLVAALYSPINDDFSFASLSLGTGSPLLYRPGATVDNKTVDSIYPEAVFMKGTTGTLCSLTMFKSPNAPKPPPAAPVVAEATPTSAADAELDKGITQVSDTKYGVRRALVDKLLQNQAELMRSARVVPHEENGRVVGVKLYGIRKSSLLGKLGLQNGDMMRTINGFDMGSPDSALEAYAKLRTASNLSVALVRRGSAVTMEYNIVN
jgi:general secretion pathway protein C